MSFQKVSWRASVAAPRKHNKLQVTMCGFGRRRVRFAAIRKRSSSVITTWQFPRWQEKQSLPVLITHPKENNGYLDPTGEIHRKSKFADFSLNVNNSWQESSSQSNQQNPITLHDQKEYTDCRVLPSDSAAIQTHSASGNGNSLPRSWSEPDFMAETRIKHQYRPECSSSWTN